MERRLSFRHGRVGTRSGCCAAVGVEDYTLKDACHSVDVRMRFAGKSYEEIVDRLGNSAWQVAAVYARLKSQDRPKVESA